MKRNDVGTGDCTWLLRITVPPPRSGYVVDLLREVPQVVSAAAVYSEVDVVAVVRGEPNALKGVLKQIHGWHAPIRKVRTWAVDEVSDGPRARTRAHLLKNSYRAYVVCDVSVSRQSADYAAAVLASVPAVRTLYLCRTRNRVVLDVVADDRGHFDDVVMREIQGRSGVVRSTRTLVGISEPAWERKAKQDGSPTIFLGMSVQDLQFGSALSDRLRLDTGLKIWDYRQIPTASGSWPRTVDQAMKAAPLHLYVMSETFLHSPECVGEYTRSTAESRRIKDTLCVVEPGLDVRAIGVRIQERQLVLADQFLAYPKVMDWIRKRLK
ncbi:MAG: hypothetical protein JWN95_1731 [Frankiales bacterium]|nr:hypothetical protein [Frankiales bacterium]